ncbi:MAG: AarF/ABC1/UbiB kinase family protein [Leptospiraceae bacterium]|nr:AarF/ABC1/UbiB kinase family protein [Leptospiraceae bacterium]MCP5494072.1 AarF/ABC1/UbiB kinase family protein [Leptospiraceae bacterium]
MKKESSESHPIIFTYRNKSYLSRFFIVYIFFLKKLVILLWHYKVLKLFLSPEKISLREERIFKDLGDDCKKIFLKLGGVYIKVGQFLSNLTHILPLSFIDALKDLQDRIPPHSFNEIKERFHNEIHQDITDVFPDIDRVPLAAASTAQVHTATLYNEKVVIKILYPDIENLINKDLKTLKFVMKRLNRYLFRYEYKKIHKEIEVTIKSEMDLLKESRSITRMTELFAKEPNIIFPDVYPEFASMGVLVTRFVEGVKITEYPPTMGKNDKKSNIVDLLMRAYILMIFKYKFFHADPHPGNLIITPDEKLCFVDFGAVCEVNESTTTSLRKIIMSAMTKDYFGVIEGMEEMGFFSSDANKDKLEKIARYAIENLKRFITNTEFFRNVSLEDLNAEDAYLFLKGINSSLSELLKIAHVPQNYVMLERVLGLLVGNIAYLDPYRTIFDYAEVHFESIVVGGTTLERTWEEEGGGEALANMISIPGDFHRALLAINRGRLSIKNADVEKQTEKTYILGHQFIYTAILIASIQFGNNFLDKGIIWLSYLFYFLGFSFSLILIVSFIKNRLSKM